MNEQIVTWHLLEDVLGWVAVLIVSAVMMVGDVPVLDPLLSVGITLWVTYNALKGLKRTMDLFMQAVPSGVDLEALCRKIRTVAMVRDVQHLHVWSLEGEHHVLTGQLVVEPAELEAALAVRDEVRELIREEGIEHATLELALRSDGPGASCERGPEKQACSHEH